MRKVLGVIGGMGPEATSYFYSEVIAHTKALTDQEHLDMVILNHASMPDRTRAILSGDHRDLLAAFEKDCRALEALGAANIAIPCNTSHYFYDQIQAMTQVPIIHMPEESARAAAAEFPGARRIGIIGTDGTVRAGIYHRACEKAGMIPVVPSEEAQRLAMAIIYDEIKSGKTGDREKFAKILADLKGQGAEAVILACTELSVYKKYHGVPAYCLDAMDILVKEAIVRSGAQYLA